MKAISSKFIALEGYWGGKWDPHGAFLGSNNPCGDLSASPTFPLSANDCMTFLLCKAMPWQSIHVAWAQIPSERFFAKGLVWPLDIALDLPESVVVVCMYKAFTLFLRTLAALIKPFAPLHYEYDCLRRCLAFHEVLVSLGWTVLLMWSLLFLSSLEGHTVAHSVFLCCTGKWNHVLKSFLKNIHHMPYHIHVTNPKH